MQTRILALLLVVASAVVMVSFVAEAQNAVQQQRGRALAEQLLGPKVGPATKKYEPSAAARSLVQKMSKGQKATFAKQCDQVDVGRKLEDYEACYVVQQNLAAETGDTKDIWDWGVFATCFVASCIADDCETGGCACHCAAVAHETIPECKKKCGVE
jgi:hypothetical protein